MILYYFFYDGKPDSCAGIYIFSVKFLEHLKNAFAEMYIAESEEAYAQFKESEDQAADSISEKLSAYMKNGKAKYTTYVESL